MGLVEIGSAATGRSTPHSDLDLVLVLAAPSPRIHVGLTQVGGRLTESFTALLPGAGDAPLDERLADALAKWRDMTRDPRQP